MKMLSCLFMSLLLATPFSAIADPDSSPANTTDNPYAQYDPDGVPLTITQGKRQRTPTAAEIEAFQKQQAQIAYEKNWLLRGYEEQLRAHDSQNSGKEADSDSNIYYQLSLNKDLAKLAHLPDADTAGPDNGLTLKVNASPTGPHPATLRTDTTPGKPEPLSLSTYKPLVTPMSALDAITSHDNFSTFKPSTAFSPFADQNSQPAPAPKSAPDSSLDSVDLETPGMVAAKSDLSDPNLTDLSLDMLPGESADQARARVEMNQNPHLPVLMDADEMHREQAAALSPAGVKQLPTVGTGTITPPVAQPVPQVNEAPMPVNQIPQINPVRAPIANPYDILNR